jgi:peptide chain release factor subunit 1
MPIIAELNAQLDRLAAVEPGPFPVISLYLDLRPNERGRDRFDPFLRKELNDRLKTYGTSGPERESLEADAERIRRYVANVDPALNGLALFASNGADLFEPVPLAVPVGDHRLFVGSEPHLYPLARVLDRYPRYAALLADTHSARIFVFAANTIERTDRIENAKTRRHKMGGWSQARYQRHMENGHLRHAKEVVDALERIVREEGIDRVVLAGDEPILSLLRERLPKDVSAAIVDVIRLDVRSSEREVLEATVAALRDKEEQSDRDRVEALAGASRAGGLARIGVQATANAFELGQVDEVLLPAAPAADFEAVADRLVLKARQTSAGVRFIEDAALLAPLGGVGAFLRFQLEGRSR